MTRDMRKSAMAVSRDFVESISRHSRINRVYRERDREKKVPIKSIEIPENKKTFRYAKSTPPGEETGNRLYALSKKDELFVSDSYY